MKNRTDLWITDPRGTGGPVRDRPDKGTRWREHFVLGSSFVELLRFVYPELLALFLEPNE